MPTCDEGAQVEGDLCTKVGGLAALDQGQGSIIPVAVAQHLHAQGACKADEGGPGWG